MKLSRLMRNVRVLIVLAAIILALISISPNPFASGVAIRGIEKGSAAAEAGIALNPAATPAAKERIMAMNNVEIKDVGGYYDFVSTLQPNRTVQIKTNRGIYKLTTKPKTRTVELNYTINRTVSEKVVVNETANGTAVPVTKSVNRTVEERATRTEVTGTEDPGFRVYDAPKNNIRLGLDLQGGTRVLLQPDTRLSPPDMAILLDNMKERLNVYGLSDIVVREATDLEGNRYILVEVAGVNEEEVKELVAKQGKFEAKIANSTVFRGGNDITYVCRSADCSGIDPQVGCGPSQGGVFCRFRFSISLSQEAAERQANLTKDLSITTAEGGQPYLSETLQLYLDDQLVDTLNIGAELKGKAATSIQISGSGFGASQQDAAFSAIQNMHKLQTVLITGSLPVKLSIIKADSISPLLGREFIMNAFLMAAAAIATVLVVLIASYRNFKIALPIMLTSLLEVFLLLGVAAAIGWNVDLAAIAGIIAAVGTGVNDQIIITDEALKGESRKVFGWKEKIKNAFTVIWGAYFTLTVAMLPLLFAGAGLLKGFALTTIIGMSVGVFITRPAYAAVVEEILKE